MAMASFTSAELAITTSGPFSYSTAPLGSAEEVSLPELPLALLLAGAVDELVALLSDEDPHAVDTTPTANSVAMDSTLTRFTLCTP
jgi:hypothetical protein